MDRDRIVKSQLRIVENELRLTQSVLSNATSERLKAYAREKIAELRGERRVLQEKLKEDK